jgi:glycosyltransferase involved in cell wall biosynthesis
LNVLRNPTVPFTDRPIAAQNNQKVAFVGRLDAEKGGLFLARACAKAGLQLMVMGEGPEYDAIAATGAEMHGWCDRARIGAVLREARVLAMPSQYPEPFGLVAVEALGCGLPVIAARSALLAEEIASAGAGFAFDATDEAALINCLTGVLQDDAVIAQCSARALAIAGHIGLSPERWLDGLEAAYARALSRADAGAT